jgi:hypothetical protein
MPSSPPLELPASLGAPLASERTARTPALQIAATASKGRERAQVRAAATQSSDEPRAETLPPLDALRAHQESRRCRAASSRPRGESVGFEPPPNPAMELSRLRDRFDPADGASALRSTWATKRSAAWPPRRRVLLAGDKRRLSRTGQPLHNQGNSHLQAIELGWVTPGAVTPTRWPLRTASGSAAAAMRACGEEGVCAGRGPEPRIDADWHLLGARRLARLAGQRRSSTLQVAQPATVLASGLDCVVSCSASTRAAPNPSNEPRRIAGGQAASQNGISWAVSSDSAGCHS